MLLIGERGNVVDVVSVAVVSRAVLSLIFVLLDVVWFPAEVCFFTWFLLSVGDCPSGLNDHSQHASLGSVEPGFHGLSDGPRSRGVQDGWCHLGVEEYEPVLWWVVGALGLLLVVCNGGPCAFSAMRKFRRISMLIPFCFAMTFS